MENTAPNTNNFLNWVEIKNFKSIKDLRLDCKRVNVFIGKPNVGKSNILEGLGLLGGSYSDNKYLNGALRYRELRDLFYDNNINLSIQIDTGDTKVALKKSEIFKENATQYDLSWKPDAISTRSFLLSEKGELLMAHKGATLEVGVSPRDPMADSFDIETGYRLSPLKKYDFANLTQFKNSFSNFLLPPNGPNLYEVVRRNRELWGEFAKLFTEQNLELVLYDEKQELILQKKDGPFVIQYPFFSIADTFRRFMFYITAIESNKNSVIVFEEPEVHSFPPYTQEMAYRIIYDEDNQYFISTHSPYLLHTLIENLEEDQLNVYITYYENYETKVKLLTPENLREVLDFSIDVFFNLDKFLVNA